jgi:hypothetical protein
MRLPTNFMSKDGSRSRLSGGSSSPEFGRPLNSYGRADAVGISGQLLYQWRGWGFTE